MRAARRKSENDEWRLVTWGWLPGCRSGSLLLIFLISNLRYFRGILHPFEFERKYGGRTLFV